MQLKQVGIIGKHLLIWCLLTFFLTRVNWIWSVFSTNAGTIQWPIVWGMAFNALLFYLNALWTYPRYRRKRWRYWLLAIAVIFAVSILESLVDFYYADSLGIAWAYFKSINLPEHLDAHYRLLVGIDMFIVVFPVNFIYWLASFAYLLPKERLRNTRLQNENLQAELRQLKAQMEPHTLFNGINGIYHLIDEEPAAAKQYLLGFSDVLRYHIYSGQQEKISLEKEIEFLNHYFELSQLRVGEGALISWDFPENSLSHMVAPLLFYPFAENAFKYLSDFEHPADNQLTASMEVGLEGLHFQISNSYRPENRTAGTQVGLANIRERLSLIYPGKHSLVIDEREGSYKVNLQINLHE